MLVAACRLVVPSLSNQNNAENIQANPSEYSGGFFMKIGNLANALG